MISALLALTLMMDADRSLSGVNDTRWIELRRTTLSGTLDAGFTAKVLTPTCQATYRPTGRTRRPTWRCPWPVMVTDKNYRYEARAGNDAGASAWRREAPLTCKAWSGPDGCPTSLLPVEP